MNRAVIGNCLIDVVIASEDKKKAPLWGAFSFYVMQLVLQQFLNLALSVLVDRSDKIETAAHG